MGGKPIKFAPELIIAAFAETSARSRAARVRIVCDKIQCSKGTVERALKGRHGPNTQTRSPAGPARLGLERRANVLPVGHPATVERRTLFPTTVRDVDEHEWLLKKGKYSAKLGSVITKGAWTGFPIYCLTLEERATCPTSCRHWSSCYGNNMQMARRWKHGPPLEKRLANEVAALELDHPRGFAIRLHSLGDFYSVTYVELWRSLIDQHDALHVFGYTARINTVDDDIAYAVARLVRDRWPRFAIRFSNAPIDRCSTLSIESPVQKPDAAFICPAQWTPSGKKTECCATCALCWSTTKPVAFLQH